MHWRSWRLQHKSWTWEKEKGKRGHLWSVWALSRTSKMFSILQGQEEALLLLSPKVLRNETKVLQWHKLLLRYSDRPLPISSINILTLGNSCPKPGSIPNGQWSCQTQELPIPDATFLDGDANTYPGRKEEVLNLNNCFLSSPVPIRLPPWLCGKKHSYH